MHLAEALQRARSRSTISFSVRARDAAGNLDPTPATQIWTVTPPPDTTPPDTSIGSGPPASTTSTSASFGFASTEAGSSFECKLDAGSWAACTSPKPYSGLALGAHQFSVRARDAAGNLDPTPATADLDRHPAARHHPAGHLDRQRSARFDHQHLGQLRLCLHRGRLQL